MLERRSFHGTDEEHEAVQKLLDEFKKSNLDASITRTEPGESGPLRVEIGRRSWIVHEDGKVKKETP